MFARCVCSLLFPKLFAEYVCCVCLPCMLALNICPLCLPYISPVFVCPMRDGVLLKIGGVGSEEGMGRRGAGQCHYIMKACPLAHWGSYFCHVYILCHTCSPRRRDPRPPPPPGDSTVQGPIVCAFLGLCPRLVGTVVSVTD